jgi:hypothetical protein
VARLLELDKLAGQCMAYNPSRNRQWHLYSSSSPKDSRTAVKRLFLRGLVRQLGHPALLAATYSGNSAAVATAAVNELEEALVSGRSCSRLCRLVWSLGELCVWGWCRIHTDGIPLLTGTQMKEHSSTPCSCLRCSSCLQCTPHTLTPHHTLPFHPAPAVQLNCLEELTRPSPDHGAAGRADWVHMYHSVLPLLPLHHAKEEVKVAGALRSTVAALVAKHNSAFRTAGVAVWEIRFRVPDVSGAWRVLVSCPTGEAGHTTQSGLQAVGVMLTVTSRSSFDDSRLCGQHTAPIHPPCTTPLPCW